MDENERTFGMNDKETGDNLPVPADTALTIPASRLAGSINCMNCGTSLQGPFCHYCGQPDKNFMRFFPVLMRELLVDFLDFDSRFIRTLKPLLFRPGKLTRDYLDGKRFRYVPPLRLYVFSSLALFFLAAILAGGAIQVNSAVDEDGEVVSGIHIGEPDRDEIHKSLESLEEYDPELAAEVQQKIEAAEEAEGDDEISHDDFNFNGEPWHRETNPLIIPFMPNWVNEWINDEIEESPQKGKEIEANPNLITDKVFEVLPGTMFVLLPIVALLFKFWYLFAKKYYIEHLIFALHNHSFIFVTLLITLLLGALADWVEPDSAGRMTTVVEWITAAIWFWIPVYLLVSLKRVYQQGWGMTLAKYSLVGVSYMMLLLLTAGFVALLSFLLL
jgi:hypothetical protein